MLHPRWVLKRGLGRSSCGFLGHAATIGTLSYAIRFWSKGKKRALFLRHEGFLYVPSLLLFDWEVVLTIHLSSRQGRDWCMDQEYRPHGC